MGSSKASDLVNVIGFACLFESVYFIVLVGLAASTPFGPWFRSLPKQVSLLLAFVPGLVVGGFLERSFRRKGPRPMNWLLSSQLVEAELLLKLKIVWWELVREGAKTVKKPTEKEREGEGVRSMTDQAVKQLGPKNEEQEG